MAMSMKKIGAIAVGGAMVASALATGAFAAEKVGDVDAFAADVVADGNANVDIVVGSNAAALDVVSAANIAAKIGSLMFKEGTVEDGAATVSVSASASSDDLKIYDDNSDANVVTLPREFIASADKDYNALFATAVNGGDINFTYLAANNSLGKLDTLLEIEDVDPSDWTVNDKKSNAAELVYVKVTNKSDAGVYEIKKNDAYYISLVTNNDANATTTLSSGMRMALLGEEKVFIKLDEDDFIQLGDEAFDGVMKEGESYDLGNGYTVELEAVLESVATTSTTSKVSVKILKDGKVVAEKFDEASSADPLKLVYKDVGVVVNKAWKDIGGNYGYAELVICDNVQTLDLDEEFIPDWKLYVFDAADKKFEKKESSITTPAGIALKYVGDGDDEYGIDDTLEIADYVTFEFEDDDDDINAIFKMDQAKEVSLAIGQTVNVLNAEIKLAEIDAEAKEAVVMTAPIAVLDSEASLDAADKGLILVGGPVVNELTAELADAGLVAIDNESPATLAVAAGAANGNDVLVVAGGDRAATEEAAEALIDML
ncbi:S-layer protein Sla [Methanococcus maripaludis]|uniref:S-layer protein n=1 Tax=Methanococcus maripaludis TaxID=39152 RepID=UPI003141BB25